MGKTSYQSLDQIANEITSQIAKLNSGELSHSEIENLTNNTQELYERLIVIRHKAYEKYGNVEETTTIVDEPKTVIEEKEEEPIFDFATTPEPEQNEQEAMAFDFSEPISEPESTPIVNEKEESINIEEKSIPTETQSSLNEQISTQSSSLNDSFKEKSTTSLADRLNQSKISDLKSSIDINKKFSFISNLFNGSNENYNAAINQLNNCTDGDKARLVLAELLTKNNWEVEDPTVTSFVEIVERRFV